MSLFVLFYAYAVSTDCPNLIQFAYNLGIQLNQPNIWSQLQVNCCGASGISCLNQRVTEIDWAAMNLDGNINGTAIPVTVTKLFLFNNVLNGTIPSDLPSGLASLALDNNKLTGKIPLSLPAGLKMLHASGNSLSGDLPIFPLTLDHLMLGYPGRHPNQLTGTLRLNSPIEIYINDNWITDVVVQDSSHIDPSSCDLSNNPLYGNPNILSLTVCIKNGLYNASSLPNTLISTSTANKGSLATASQPIPTQSISARLDQQLLVLILLFKW